MSSYALYKTSVATAGKDLDLDQIHRAELKQDLVEKEAHCLPMYALVTCPLNFVPFIATQLDKELKGRIDSINATIGKSTI